MFEMSPNQGDENLKPKPKFSFIDTDYKWSFKLQFEQDWVVKKDKLNMPENYYRTKQQQQQQQDFKVTP